jgi:hypothetical protein
MAAPANECIPYFEPGNRPTAKITETGGVLGKRFVEIAGNRTSGPALASTAEGGVYQCNYPALKGKVFGVTSHDCAENGLVTILRGSGMIVPVVADGAITAGTEVEVTAVGKVRTLTDGVAVGYAASGCADGADCEVALYR